jgi:DNA-binding NarL/FixJ family response regulator
MPAFWRRPRDGPTSTGHAPLAVGRPDSIPPLGDTASVAGDAIDVLVVEDNEVFREALEILLGLADDLRVVGAVAGGEAALEACREYVPDVVVVDYRLPDLDGVETTRALRASCPEAAVVALTAAADEPAITALLEAGAVSCLTKDRELDEIVEAIRAAGGGARTG